MAGYSREQLRKLLTDAGFKKNGVDTEIMVSIAYAESGGNPNAHNNKPPDDSYGLWQINMRGKLGPDRRKRFGITDNRQLFDPATNARAAYIIYKDQGLNAWTTYTRGTYMKYADGTSPEEGGHANPVDGAKDAISDLNPTNGISNAINAFGETVFKGVSNIAGILIAIVCVVLGVVLLMRNALPIGKVAKVAKGLAK
jgi:hypothetical protein